MSTYKVLNKQIHNEGDFSLVPIRMQDRYAIMQWRNEQIYHLRQHKPLTKVDQDTYFENVVSKLFNQEKPEQILFSFLKNSQCIGYGGLVHINWLDQNAEISFVMDTLLQEENFESYWTIFLGLIKRVAFRGLNLHKIYTYAFDLRPRLYAALEAGGFVQECRLKNHCLFNKQYYDVIYHGCINPRHHLEIRLADENDAELLYKWVNDAQVRKSSLNSNVISWETHLIWFENKLKSKSSKIYICQNILKKPVGQVRIDQIEDKWVIDYSIDKTFRGIGLGEDIIQKMLAKNEGKSFKAEVKLENFPSQKVFEKIGFKEVSRNKTTILYTWI